MNSSLKILDQQTDLMLKKINSGLIMRWSHGGYSDFMKESIELINVDIHLLEERPQEYEEKTQKEEILSKVFAILSDSISLILSREMNTEVHQFLYDYLVLVNNWNQINPNESIAEDVRNISRVLELINTIDGLIMRASNLISILEQTTNKVEQHEQNQSYTFKTSSTYLQAIKDSLNKNKSKEAVEKPLLQEQETKEIIQKCE